MSDATAMLNANWVRGQAPQGGNTTASETKPVLCSDFPLGKRVEFHANARSVEGGEVLAYCTDLPGALAQGADSREALQMLEDVVRAMVAAYREAGETIPFGAVTMEPDDVPLATIVVDE